MMDGGWLPGLSLGAQAVLRVAYGVLLLATLTITLPQARRFFLSERWGGYAKSSPGVDAIQNPYVLPVVLGAWLAAAALLVAGRHTVAAALVNLLLSWYFFVAMRWRGLLRGMGAPGFMCFWLAACVFFLEYGLHHDSSGRVRGAALLAFRIDFAVIMLCAGTYKALAGYPKNDGMELGLVNPWWGYWGRFYRRLRPESPVFRVLNHLAYGTEIAAGLLMLIPPTAATSALLIAVSFAFIATQIRLGFLCEMVIVATALFVAPGSVADRLLSAATGAPGPSGATAPWWMNAAVTAALLGYAALLPLAKAGQYYNLLAGKPLPRLAQAALDRYTNLFGIIIWRVFSADHTNFFARIHGEDPATGRRLVWADFRRRSPAGRYAHVGELICLVSLFTTLKYYPADTALFADRLLRYARTLPSPPGPDVIFEYVCLRKEGGRFEEVVAAEYAVDVQAGRVVERVLDPTLSVRAPGRASPIHEGARPGSYAPATTRS